MKVASTKEGDSMVIEVPLTKRFGVTTKRSGFTLKRSGFTLKGPTQVMMEEHEAGAAGPIPHSTHSRERDCRSLSRTSAIQHEYLASYARWRQGTQKQN